MISQIKVGNTTYSVGLITPAMAALFSMSGDYSNNLTVGKYATSNGTVKHINLEAGVVTENGSTKRGDIQLKPCDDIAFYSHHRESGNQDKVHLTALLSYTSSGTNYDMPVELILNCADLTLSTKGKDMTKVYSNISGLKGNKSDADSDIFNMYVKKSVSTTGNAYLKVRARAIDLRCEEHGGIALQPKGSDSNSKHNKVKFEHGGGDGLEFFTMNDEKMSAFVDEYRFNKDGIWYMSTRTKLDNTYASENDGDDGYGNGKKDSTDDTTYYSYQKADDDFYDNIDASDESCTTKDLIKTAYTFNGAKNRHAKITSSGNIEIQTNKTYTWAIVADGTADETYEDENTSDVTKVYNESDFDELPDLTKYYGIGEYVYKLNESDSPNINFKSDGNISLDAADTLSLKGTVDFGSTLDFGELEGDDVSAAGLRFDHKLTKKQAQKPCDIIGINVINNSTKDYTWTGMETTPVCPDSATVSASSSSIVASCSVYDIIKLVTYMKTNNQGPWAA